MHQHSASTDRIRRRKRSRQRVYEESLPEPSAVLAAVNRKASQQNYPDRMAGQPFHDTSRRFFLAHSSGGKRIIGDDPAVAMQDVRSRGVVGLIRKREAPKPLVQGRLSAVKRRNVMVLRKSFNVREMLAEVDGVASLPNV